MASKCFARFAVLCSALLCPTLGCGDDSQAGSGEGDGSETSASSGTGTEGATGTTGVIPDGCRVDVAAEGDCSERLGFYWDHASDRCRSLSGCSCVGADCEKLVPNKTACEWDHSECWQRTDCLKCEGQACMTGPYDGLCAEGEGQARCRDVGQRCLDELTCDACGMEVCGDSTSCSDGSSGEVCFPPPPGGFACQGI